MNIVEYTEYLVKSLVEDPEKIWLWSPLFDLLYRNEEGEFVEYSDSVLAPKQSEEENSEKPEENA